MSDYKSPLEEIVFEYAEAMKKREKYIVYAKSKPLGLSFGKSFVWLNNLQKVEAKETKKLVLKKSLNCEKSIKSLLSSSVNLAMM